MNRTKISLLMMIIMLAVALVVAPDALAKKKSSKKSKKKSSKYSENYDPYKGRIGIGFSLGGTSGSGGSGFSGSVGLTYYINKYLSTMASVGYGFAPYVYENEEGDDETVNVKFVPAEISMHIHPLPMNKLSPYFGPGVGMTYVWYELDDEKYEETWYHGFGEAGVTYWAAPNVGLNFGIRYSVPYYDDEWQTDDGQLTYGASGSIVF